MKNGIWSIVTLLIAIVGFIGGYKFKGSEKDKKYRKIWEDAKKSAEDACNK